MANEKDSGTESKLETVKEDVSVETPESEEKEQILSEISSGAVAYSADSANIDDELVDDDELTDDDELDDEEYERIKHELLKEYMLEDEHSSQTNVITESENNDTTAPENIEEAQSEISPKSVAVPPAESSSESAEPNAKSIQDDINKLMGSGIVTPNKKASDDLEVVEEKLDGNVIDDDAAVNQDIDSLTPDVDKGISRVAISKGSSVAIMALVVLFLLYVIYKMLEPDQDPNQMSQSGKIDPNAPIVKPVQDVGQTIVVPDVPKFPDTPKALSVPSPQSMPVPPIPPLLDVSALTPPAPPSVATAPAGLVPPPIGSITPTAGPATSVIQDLGDLDENAAQKKAQDDARKQARLKSSIMVAGGGGGKRGGANNQQDLTKLMRSGNQIAATYIGDLHRIIAQGKVIDAVLETAINTDLPGQIRAVVSRDVYSEGGKNILINRGSRLIGSYSANIKFGQARVQITWDRIIRPDGVDVKVASLGIDDIGRAGAPGDIDNHILRNLTLAMMMSSINVTIGALADQVSDTSGTTTTTSSTDATSGTTSSSSTSDTLTNQEQAYQDGLDNISKVTNDVLSKSLNMPPTVTVDQGTPLKVFVQKDIVFPGASANLTRMID